VEKRRSVESRGDNREGENGSEINET